MIKHITMRNATKVHVIYCHPSITSVTHDIKEAYLKGLNEKDIQYTITDLYESKFNTDISEKEYLRENNNIHCELSKDVQSEQEKINNADILTFIFPLFWMDAPSKLVGYFTRVFTKGFRYDHDDGRKAAMKKMKQTNFLISAGSGYEDLERDGKIKALETVFVKDRMSQKTEKCKMYFFCETTYNKEILLNNRRKYSKMAYEIGKNTI